MFLETTSVLAPTSSTLPTSLGVAIVMGYILDWVKRLQSLPKINYYTTKLNSWIRLLMAFGGTVGISWTWSALPGGGHTWTWTIPTATVLLASLWHIAVQYGAQHGWEILLAQRQIAKQAEAVQLSQGANLNQGQAVARKT
jgi:hypothetical protein